MSFLHLEFIYLMLPVLFILFGLLLTQSAPQEQFFSLAVLKKLRVDTNQLSAKVRNVFYLLMFVFIILALADPVIEGGSAKVKAEGGPLYIALDVSRSMLCEDVYPNRLSSAKQQLSALLNSRTSTEVGLLAFAKYSYLVSPATGDHAFLHLLLKGLDSGTVSEQGTNMLTLLKAVDRLGEEGREKRVLIITDGGENPDFNREIDYAKKHRITVYTLGIGTAQGTKIPEIGGGHIISNGKPVISRLNSSLNTLAEASGGKAVESDNMRTLLGKSNADSSEGEEKPIYYHLFILPVGFAMLMLVLATSSFYRGEKYYLPALMFMGLLLQPEPLTAGLFDYKRLDAAKSAYQNEAYSKSSRVYQQYALENESLEAIYNAANGYYRAGRYKEAVGLYESIYFVEADKNHQLYHNLGNALARLGSEDDLKKAVEAYEKALTFRDDQATRENLEQVEAALKKREEEYLQRSALGSSLASGLKSPSESSPNSGSRKQAKSSEDLSDAEAGMSAREAAKWFMLLNQQHGTTLTKIDVDNPDKGVEREKPW